MRTRLELHGITLVLGADLEVDDLVLDDGAGLNCGEYSFKTKTIKVTEVVNARHEPYTPAIPPAKSSAEFRVPILKDDWRKGDSVQLSTGTIGELKGIDQDGNAIVTLRGSNQDVSVRWPDLKRWNDV